jgi:hypothetical protein
MHAGGPSALVLLGFLLAMAVLLYFVLTNFGSR